MVETHARSRAFRGIAFAFAAITLIPLLLCRPLPLNDFQAHLARMYILDHIQTSPSLQQFYQVRWDIIPNLAMDIIVPPLARLLPLRVAGDVMIAATLLLLAGSAMLLHRKLSGHISYFPLAAFLLLYNRTFLWGFINYLFGLALAILGFTLWLQVRKKSGAVRSLSVLAIGLVVFICHLAAFGVLAILIGCYEVSDAYHWRMRVRYFLAISMAWFIPLVLAGSLIFLGPTTSRSGDLIWGDLRMRLSGLLDIVNNYSLPLDLFTFVLLVGGLVFAVVRGYIAIKPRMVLALTVIFAVQMALPETIFNSSGAGKRLSIAFFFLLVASLDFTGKSLRAERAFVGIVAILFVARMSVVAWNWHKASTEYAAITAELNKIPPGVRVYPLVVQYTFPRLQNPPLNMIAATLVWDREDYIPIFTEVGQQPLRTRIEYPPGTRDIKAADFIVDNLHGQKTLVNPFADFPFASYDYIAVIGRDGMPADRPDVLQPVDQQGIVEILRVDHTRVARK